MRVRNAGAIFVGPWAPVSLGDYAAGSNHVLPTGGCACHSSGLGVASFLRGVNLIEYDRDALARRRRPRGHPGPRRGPPRPRCRHHGAVRAVSPPSERPGEPADLPLRPELRGQVPYGAPQLDVAHRLNVNENPYPPSAAMVADVAAAVAEAARGPEPVPGPRRDRAARGPRRLHRPDVPAVRRSPARQVWAANGSNEVMLQLLQAFGGPGRVGAVASRRPTRCTPTTPGHLHRVPDPAAPRRLHRRPRRGPGRTSPPSSRPSSCWPRRTTRPGRRCRWTTSTPCCAASRGMVVVDEAYAEFRRPGTPSAIELLDAHPRLVVTRTMSKAFALAGARLGYLVASPAVVDAVQLVRLPYHLSAVTQAVARTALRHAAELLGVGGRPARRARRPGRVAARPARPDGGGLRRQLRAVRSVRRPATRSGSACSTAGSSSARPARPAGCGSASAPPRRWRRSARPDRQPRASRRARMRRWAHAREEGT